MMWGSGDVQMLPSDSMRFAVPVHVYYLFIYLIFVGYCPRMYMRDMKLARRSKEITCPYVGETF